METIVHRIRLTDIGQYEAFERWVCETDYTACRQLPSVEGFDVHRVSLNPDADCHYVEIIRVSSQLDFERDMETRTFKGLERDFSTMAEVIEEIAGQQIGQGYRRTHSNPQTA